LREGALRRITRPKDILGQKKTVFDGKAISGECRRNLRGQDEKKYNGAGTLK